MSRRSLLFFFLASLIALLTIFCVSSCDRLSEEVNISDIPGYYFENNYLDNRVRAINEAILECSGVCESFFWITDIHWEPDLNTRKSPLLVKFIASQTGVSKILNGGDTGNSQVICENAIAQFKNAVGSNRVYTVTGNHEMVDASRYESPFDRVADELRGHNDDLVYGDGDRSYFFFDDNSAKTRYIGLSSFGLYINNECESCYTPEQLAWFKNSALNVEVGWTIVIFTHSLYYVNSADKLVVSPSGANAFIDTIDKYQGKGTIACVLMGHAHKDRIHIGSTGVPYIISACDRSSAYKRDLNLKRIQGTTSEQHFEVVVIDKGSRKIKMLAIGCNSRDGYDDAPGQEVDIRTVNY